MSSQRRSHSSKVGLGVAQQDGGGQGKSHLEDPNGMEPAPIFQVLQQFHHPLHPHVPVTRRRTSTHCQQGTRVTPVGLLYTRHQLTSQATHTRITAVAAQCHEPGTPPEPVSVL
ncbi:hypothetical protein DPEC_G00277680 [Dallia pectoralis]|uniref:Uncharacterized protein n=1 Tax=Dallia pectoralis TaxID=75939 RepID=A0ACC2FM04_DALPE|nr:hypothetical protein DPEC_G00277680 [Dallia pectoralis]